MPVGVGQPTPRIDRPDGGRDSMTQARLASARHPGARRRRRGPTARHHRASALHRTRPDDRPGARSAPVPATAAACVPADRFARRRAGEGRRSPGSGRRIVRAARTGTQRPSASIRRRSRSTPDARALPLARLRRAGTVGSDVCFGRGGGAPTHDPGASPGRGWPTSRSRGASAHRCCSVSRPT